jgi:aspartyl-tRNA(Asn)/glutamyl-tRNA(Gln) amidotransferase subunit C
MNLSREDVEKVSLLGRLRLTSQELETMTSQLSAIVGYIEQLKALDTTNVEPMAHAMELRNVFAEDALRPSLSRAEALANAPKKDNECYRVPAVLGE